jgi:hypothetical protein
VSRLSTGHGPREVVGTAVGDSKSAEQHVGRFDIFKGCNRGRSITWNFENEFHTVCLCRILFITFNIL